MTLGLSAHTWMVTNYYENQIDNEAMMKSKQLTLIDHNLGSFDEMFNSY